MRYEIAYTFLELPITQFKGAGGGIRTLGFLRNRVLSPAPLTWLGYPRIRDFCAIERSEMHASIEPCKVRLRQPPHNLWFLR